MKKNFNIIKIINKSKYKKLIYLSIILLFLILFIIIMLNFFNKDDKAIYEYLNEQNKNIVVSNTQKEKPGTLVKISDKLLKEQCLNDICVKRVMIYYIGKDGRVEYQVTNKGKKKASGALKLVFDTNDSVYVVYNKLKKGETIKGVVTFTNSNFSNVNDYKLVEVKKDELKKLLNNKK